MPAEVCLTLTVLPVCVSVCLRLICPSVFTDDDQLSDPDYVSWEK